MKPDNNLDKWIKEELPAIADLLEKKVISAYEDEVDERITISGRDNLYRILDLILAALFPGTYSQTQIENDKLNEYLTAQLEEICQELSVSICQILDFHRSKRCKANCTCEEKAQTASIEFIKSLPEIRAMLIEDIKSGHDGDPASKSFHEIILSYPYIEAVATYRVAHKLYELDVPVIPRVMTERAHCKTGIDIHPGAVIGSGFFIDHGTGVVIGETCVIGKNVTIYHGVTLGAFSPYDRKSNKFKGKKRHPDVEDNVIIYAGAVILGGETVIGRGSIIGGNTLVTKSVAPNSFAHNERKEVICKPLS